MGERPYRGFPTIKPGTSITAFKEIGGFKPSRGFPHYAYGWTCYILEMGTDLHVMDMESTRSGRLTTFGLCRHFFAQDRV